MNASERSGDSREDWAGRFAQQASSCAQLGSDLYGRLLALLEADVLAGGPTWALLESGPLLRFGQAGPLRLVGTAHRLALLGEAEQWAAMMPSCGGVVPAGDSALLGAWHDLVFEHGDALVDGLNREVQTNEVGRASGLALAIAESRLVEARLIELGCSSGLNLRLDRFEIDLGGIVLGHPGSPVQLQPEMRAHLGELRGEGLVAPVITERVGMDPHPIDPTTELGGATVRSFVWPDQSERLARVDAAIRVAGSNPAELIGLVPNHAGGTGGAGVPRASDTAMALEDVLHRGGPAIVMHSIVWQYIPTELRWRITEVIESAGERATRSDPLVWVRFEPDEWDRRRVAIWSREFPDGSDRLVAHADYHGRWLAPR